MSHANIGGFKCQPDMAVNATKEPTPKKSLKTKGYRKPDMRERQNATFGAISVKPFDKTLPVRTRAKPLNPGPRRAN
ncbi:hypothetical protein [Marinimicrobium koreense]|uniref:hypothetical protein n=1 Tax=Marinimicrobium koreense TaxID=306545 RepID=UPI003F6ECE83